MQNKKTTTSKIIVLSILGLSIIGNSVLLPLCLIYIKSNNTNNSNQNVYWDKNYDIEYYYDYFTYESSFPRNYTDQTFTYCQMTISDQHRRKETDIPFFYVNTVDNGVNLDNFKIECIQQVQINGDDYNFESSVGDGDGYVIDKWAHVYRKARQFNFDLEWAYYPYEPTPAGWNDLVFSATNASIVGSNYSEYEVYNHVEAIKHSVSIWCETDGFTSDWLEVKHLDKRNIRTEPIDVLSHAYNNNLTYYGASNIPTGNSFSFSVDGKLLNILQHEGKSIADCDIDFMDIYHYSILADINCDISNNKFDITATEEIVQGKKYYLNISWDIDLD